MKSSEKRVRAMWCGMGGSMGVFRVSRAIGGGGWDFASKNPSLLAENQAVTALPDVFVVWEC